MNQAHTPLVRFEVPPQTGDSRGEQTKGAREQILFSCFKSNQRSAKYVPQNPTSPSNARCA
jgi:hypothetical protein